MTRLDTKGCAHPDCLLEASYGVKGSGKAREFCARHASEQQVDTLPRSAPKRKKCQGLGCITAPSYGKAGSGKRDYCRLHAHRGMTYRGRPICTFPGCSTSVRGRVFGDSSGDSGLCTRHALSGTGVDSSSSSGKKICVHAGCTEEMFPSGCPPGRHGGKAEEFCRQHRSEEISEVPVPRAMLSTSSRSPDSDAAARARLHGYEDEQGVAGTSNRPSSSEGRRQQDDDVAVVSVGSRQQPRTVGWQPEAYAFNNAAPSSLGDAFHAESIARRESRNGNHRDGSITSRQDDRAVGEARPTPTDQNRPVNGTRQEAVGGSGSSSPRSTVSTRSTCNSSSTGENSGRGSTSSSSTNARTATTYRKHAEGFQYALDVDELGQARVESRGGNAPRGGFPLDLSARSRNARSCYEKESTSSTTSSLDVGRGPTLDTGGVGRERSGWGVLPPSPPNASRRSRREETIVADRNSSSPAGWTSAEVGSAGGWLVGSKALSTGGATAGSQSDEQAKKKETVRHEPPLLLTRQGWVKWDWKSAVFKANILP